MATIAHAPVNPTWLKRSELDLAVALLGLLELDPELSALVAAVHVRDATIHVALDRAPIHLWKMLGEQRTKASVLLSHKKSAYIGNNDSCDVAVWVPHYTWYVSKIATIDRVSAWS
jgi:hypothetical protein